MSKWNVIYTHSPFETVAKGTATVVGPEHKVRFEGPNAIHMAEGYASFKNNGPTVKIVPDVGSGRIQHCHQRTSCVVQQGERMTYRELLLIAALKDSKKAQRSLQKALLEYADRSEKTPTVAPGPYQSPSGTTICSGNTQEATTTVQVNNEDLPF